MKKILSFILFSILLNTILFATTQGHGKTEYFGDNVGIGTTTASEKLEILNGNIKTNYGISAATGVFSSTISAYSISASSANISRLYFDVNPSTDDFREGKLYYDPLYKTLSCNIDTDVNLQLGEESLVYVYNNSGFNILNGQVVYFSGGYNGYPTIALAIANSSTTYASFAVATQNINNGAYGLITSRGEIHNLDTSGFAIGDILYLSDISSGTLTNSEPSLGNYKSRIGRCLLSDASAGEIYVNIWQAYKINDLSNVVAPSPTVDDVLKWNGISWINGTPSNVSGSAGIDFYNASPTIIATGTNNDNIVATLSKTPITTAEQTNVKTATTNTVLASAWLYNTALGRNSLDAGEWNFNTYAGVNSVLGGRVSTITRQIYSVNDTTYTLTSTGIGTSRLVYSNGGDAFSGSLIDPSATNTTASYLYTPQGIYQITSSTSTSSVIITVPSTYANETAITGAIWKKLFGATSPTITSITPTYALYTFGSVQSAFTISTSTKLGAMTFFTSNNTTTVSLTYDGNTHNSYFKSPLITLHNNLAGLQGGAANEYYHTTSAEKTAITHSNRSNLDTINQNLATTNAPTFATMSLTGNAFSVGISTFVVNAGKVGIGTTSLTYPFNVAGYSLITSTQTWGAGQVSKLYFGNTNHLIQAVWGTREGLRLQSADGIRFYTYGDEPAHVERMRITDLGLVGIATTAPDSTLHVIGNVIISTITRVNVAISTVNTGSTDYPMVCANGWVMGNYLVAGKDRTNRRGYPAAGWNLDVVGPSYLDGSVEINGVARIYSYPATGDTQAYRDDATGDLSIATSDIRLKKSTETISNVLNDVCNLDVITYEDVNLSTTTHRKYGLVAQQVMEKFPELTYSFDLDEAKDVNGDIIIEKDTYYGVHYDKIAALAIQGIKELKAKNDALEARIAALENK